MPSTEFLNRPGSVWERTRFEGKQFPQIRVEMEQLAIGREDLLAAGEDGVTIKVEGDGR